MGRKVGALLCPFAWGEAGFPSNTMSPGPRPASVPSGILIHPTVWNVTDRQTGQMGQRSDSTGRTVLQTVAQKSYIGSLPFLIYQKAPEGRDATPLYDGKTACSVSETEKNTPQETRTVFKRSFTRLRHILIEMQVGNSTQLFHKHTRSSYFIGKNETC